MKIQLIGLQSTNTFQLRNDEFIKLRVLGFKKQVQLKSVLLTVNYSFEVNKYIADVSFSVRSFPRKSTFSAKNDLNQQPARPRGNNATGHIYAIV